MSVNHTSPATLPPGTSNHGNPNLVCFPPKWGDIVIFFLGNYVTHVGTVVIAPDTPAIKTCMALVMALFFPGIGVTRGVQAILSGAIFAPTDLQIAARSGALCQVVKKDGYVRSLREMNLTDRPPSKFLDTFSRTNIHGRIRLPNGYCLAMVPQNAKFIDDENTQLPTVLKPQYNIMKILITLVQLGFSITTLYRARGDQINQYGYAAFGLTVTPYAVMSFVNLIGNIIRPQYSSVYLVQSRVMLEAKQQPGAVFEGCIATLREDTLDPERNQRKAVPVRESGSRDFLWLPVFWTPLAAALLIIGLMSHFKRGNSTVVQRIFTMAWVIIGGTVGILGSRAAERPPSQFGPLESKWISRLLEGLAMLLLLPIVGVAFWVVITEILEFGICTRVD